MFIHDKVKHRVSGPETEKTGNANTQKGSKGNKGGQQRKTANLPSRIVEASLLPAAEERHGNFVSSTLISCVTKSEACTLHAWLSKLILFVVMDIKHGISVQKT